jgi:hypothetical protein
MPADGRWDLTRYLNSAVATDSCVCVCVSGCTTDSCVCVWMYYRQLCVCVCVDVLQTVVCVSGCTTDSCVCVCVSGCTTDSCVCVWMYYRQLYVCLDVLQTVVCVSGCTTDSCVCVWMYSRQLCVWMYSRKNSHGFIRCPSSVQDHVQVNFRKGCWLVALNSADEAGCNSESSTLTLGPAEPKHTNTMDCLPYSRLYSI